VRAADDVAAIGRCVRATRESLGVDERTLAERAGITARHLRQIELGQADPHHSTLEKLVSNGLGMTLADFMRQVDETRGRLR
jgi:transcriptional regulator with XRE-family HTH domain